MILKRREKVAEYLTRGCENTMSIAAALGVAQSTIQNDIKAIELMWINRAISNIGKRRELHTQRILWAAFQASNAWERSKQNAEEISTEYIPKKCPECSGTGFEAGTENWCNNCKGKGEVLIEKVIRRIKGQVGDPQFLRLFKDLAETAAKWDGVVPAPTVKVDQRQGVFIEQNNTTNQQINLEAIPSEKLLEIRSLFGKMTSLPRPPEITLDAESEEVEPELEDINAVEEIVEETEENEEEIPPPPKQKPKPKNPLDFDEDWDNSGRDEEFDE